MEKNLLLKDIVKDFGDYRALDHVSIEIPAGKFVTLLGPSGCGKTTLLRIIAGFLTPDEGEVIFGDRVMNEVPANKRNTAMCFQSYALFPHKSVYENIRFGLRMHKVPQDQQPDIIKHAMEIVNLLGLENRKPYELSGGQQQRVALARCIVVRPDILLFDEPLSNLDAKLRESVRVEIRNLQRDLGITTIYVTHDQAEALAISDQIVSMSAGHIQQIASPKEIYERPANKFVADFIGTANIVQCTSGHPQGESWVYETDIGTMVAGSYGNAAEDQAEYSLCWRPEDMVLLGEQDHPENMNRVQAHITHSVYMGNLVDIFLEVGQHTFRTTLPKEQMLQENSTAYFGIPYHRTHVLRG
ncbi:ABC transporter ATP-binding protein [Oscillibacter sp.]|uniref:ABC transporter ATP-binding protein n=1 Tax=Oscillibacter sp. TaxID=1945593 RepID=UPI002D7EAFA9|nr:ABC transporter ATP-binding protein [Oscillibacter sp.]